MVAVTIKMPTADPTTPVIKPKQSANKTTTNTATKTKPKARAKSSPIQVPSNLPKKSINNTKNNGAGSMELGTVSENSLQRHQSDGNVPSSSSEHFQHKADAASSTSTATTAASGAAAAAPAAGFHLPGQQLVTGAVKGTTNLVVGGVTGSAKLVGGAVKGTTNLVVGGVTGTTKMVGGAVNSTLNVVLMRKQQEEAENIHTLQHAYQILAQLQQAMVEQEHRERDYAQNMAVHMDRARARLTAGNQRGAALSMKRHLLLKHSKGNCEEAVAYLQRTEYALVDAVQAVKEQARQKKYDKDENDLAMDMTDYVEYADEVDQILNLPPPPEINNMSDDELLQALSKAVMKSIRV